MEFKDKLSKPEIIGLALPSNYNYGKAIFERGAVEIINANSELVEAWVGGLKGKMSEGGGSRRRVQFVSTTNGMKWHCTGNPKNHQIFCKHCVGLALFLLK